GLDYPGVGPQHSHLHTLGRAEYWPVTDAEAMSAFRLLCATEGIIPAIESAHALAGALTVGGELGSDGVLLINLSGRRDKDVTSAADYVERGDDEGKARTSAPRARPPPARQRSRPRAHSSAQHWSPTFPPAIRVSIRASMRSRRWSTPAS